jgi:chemotaxis protein methyltransferase CheR
VALDGDIVAAVAERLAEHAGLELPPWLVEARVTSRIAALAMTPSQYVALISSATGGGELDRLTEAVRVGESRLFRHKAQLSALVDDVVPLLRERRTVRVWSAGCSTGEEPYTLAAVLARELSGVSVSILATDLSTEALNVARRGRYPRTAAEHIPVPWHEAFVIDDDAVHVRSEIASLVTFERGNLLNASTVRGFDLVWCRNVLIYFSEAARRSAIAHLVDSTLAGGFLFVGASESLRDVSQLRAARAGEGRYYVREHPADESTPRPVQIALAPPPDELLVLEARPTAHAIASDLSARLAIVGLRRLVVDLDPAELLDDAIAPVLSRARAAARAADVELVFKATRAGTRRWLVRHALDDIEGRS